MKLGQVILYVSDMSQSVAFYRYKLGLTIQYPHVDDYSDQPWVAIDAGGMNIGLHEGGSEVTTKTSPALTFFVEDCAAAVESLRAKGIEMSEPHSPHPGITIANGQDPDGNVFFVHQNG